MSKIHFHKFFKVCLSAMLVFGVAACQGATSTGPAPAAEAPAKTQPDANQAVLKTDIGDFTITKARFADEANGVRPGLNEKLLLVYLTQPGVEKLAQESFSLEAFDKAMRNTSQGEVHIEGSDGSYTICTMGGWVEDEFAIGFRVPAAAKIYTLYWPGNQPVQLSPE